MNLSHGHSEVNIEADWLTLVTQSLLKFGGRDFHRRTDALERLAAPSVSNQNRQAVGWIKICANVIWCGDFFLVWLFRSHGFSP
jgi:hypothetical protein